MTITDEIAPGEDLGRRVFSSRSRDRARRGRTPHHVFLEREGKIDISVDRLDCAPEAEAVRIADQSAVNRNATFHGWAAVAAESARTNERRAAATPQPDNPCHADILLPSAAAEDRDEQKRHAKELADASIWRERASKS